MEFTARDLDVVKSISQRGLAMHWSRCADKRPYPLHSSFEIPQRGHDPNYIVHWEVNRTTAGLDFRATYQGEHVATAFRSNWVGRSMAELVPLALRDAALAAATHCVEHGRGVYMIYRAYDHARRAIDCERLLLPLGGQAGVEHLVASMEVISPNGDVILSEVLSHFVKDFNILLACSFEPKLLRS